MGLQNGIRVNKAVSKLEKAALRKHNKKNRKAIVEQHNRDYVYAANAELLKKREVIFVE